MDNSENNQVEPVSTPEVEPKPAETEVLSTEPKVMSQPTPQFVQPVSTPAPEIPAEYKPISMWGYFGYEILFAIPCVGFILLLVFAFGGTSNINLRNFARSYFCFLIIGVILIAICMAIFGTAAVSNGVMSGSFRG